MKKHETENAPELSRKQFLQRVGIAGAGAMLGGVASTRALAAPNDAASTREGETRLAQAPAAPNLQPTIVHAQSPDRWNVRDFGARGDATNDDTKAFQDALAAAGKSGLGGTVEVPIGNYLMRGSISIPPFVTLEGIWNAPTASSQLQGSTLLPVGGRGDENGEPFITLAANSVLKGVTVFYRDQTPEKIVPYPWCIRGAGGDNMTILDCLLVNPYLGIDFATNASGRHYIRGVYGQPLKMGLTIDKCLDVGRVENVHFWPFWKWDAASGIDQWLWENGTAFQFARNDWGYVFNCFCFGYRYGYHFVRSVGSGAAAQLSGPMNGSLIGIASDATHTPLRVDATSNPGLLISNGQFVSIDIRNYSGRSGAWRDDAKAQKNPPVGLFTAPEFDGIVQLQNCTFFGAMENGAHLEGNGVVSLSNCSFKDWDRGATNAPALDVLGGVLQVNGCQFNRAAKQLRLREQALGAVFLGNRTQGKLQIENANKADLQSGFNLSPRPVASTRLQRRFYSGFENGQPRALQNVAADGKSMAAAAASADGIGMENVISTVRSGAGRNGGAAFVLSGKRAKTGHVYVYRRIFDVKIPVNADTVLRYWMKPENAASTQGGIDLLLSDGTFLRGTSAISEDGIILHPTVSKGIIGAWAPFESRIGRWLKGKTIVAILAAHDTEAGIGTFQIAFDDIEIGEPAK